jgi:hypothetical protein
MLRRRVWVWVGGEVEVDGREIETEVDGRDVR